MKALRDILARRLANSASAIVSAMSAEAIELALESVGPSDLIQVLAKFAFQKAKDGIRAGQRVYPFIDDQLRRELAKAAGGLLGANQAKQRFGVTSKTKLDGAIRERQLLAVLQAGRLKYPAFQFDLGEDSDALVALLKAAPAVDGWQILQHLFTGDDGRISDKPINLARR